MRSLIAASLLLASNMAMAQLATPTDSQKPVKHTELKWVGVECKMGVCEAKASDSPKKSTEVANDLMPKILGIPCTVVTGNMNCTAAGLINTK